MNKTPDSKTPAKKHRPGKPSLVRIILLTLLLPPVGIYLTTRHHKEPWRNPKLAASLSAWLVFWSLGISYLVLSDPAYVTPEYISSVKPLKADDSARYSSELTISSPGDTSESKEESVTDQQPGEQPNGEANTPGEGSGESGDAMSGIRMAEPENVPYDRKAYHTDWSIGSGCNLRSRLLVASSIVAVSFAQNGCTVTHGSWIDPYTGNTLTGNPAQGDGTTNDVDIDHVIPLSYANSHGGYHWSSAKKEAYGSSLSGLENEVYLPVSASENNRKSDKGPSRYYPPNPEFRCEYSRKWRDIARSYDIALSQADYQLIASVLASCQIN